MDYVMEYPQLKKQVTKLISKRCCIKENLPLLQLDLKNDLGYTQKELIQIIVQIEQIYPVCFLDDEIETVQTGEDIVRFVEVNSFRELLN